MLLLPWPTCRKLFGWLMMGQAGYSTRAKYDLFYVRSLRHGVNTGEGWAGVCDVVSTQVRAGALLYPALPLLLYPALLYPALPLLLYPALLYPALLYPDLSLLLQPHLPPLLHPDLPLLLQPHLLLLLHPDLPLLLQPHLLLLHPDLPPPAVP